MFDESRGDVIVKFGFFSIWNRLVGNLQKFSV